MPFFSIIIPTFNSAKTLKQTLDSIVSQSFLDYEVLVMDGISKDNTSKIATAYKNSRIKIISEKDQGVYDAMNKGVDKATGKWLFFLGSDDDLYDETILSKIHSQLINKNINVLYGNVIMVGDTPWAKDKTIYDGEFDLSKILQQNIAHQAIFYHQDVFKKLGRYNIKYDVNADWDFNLNAYANFEFKYTDMIIAKFSGGGISTVNTDKHFYTDKVDNIVAYFTHKLYKKEFKPFVRNILYQAKTNFKKGNLFKGGYYLIMAIYLKIIP
jgi:glycosyltransferase involved in cell wall biosynthesis